MLQSTHSFTLYRGIAVINHIITSDGNIEVTGTEGFWLPLFQYKLSFLRLLALAISESHEAADISSVAWQAGNTTLNYTDGVGPQTLGIPAAPGLTVVVIKNGVVSYDTADFNSFPSADGCPIAVRVDFTDLPYPGPIWPVVMPEWTKGIPNSDDMDAIESQLTAVADALSDAATDLAALDSRVSTTETEISNLDSSISTLQTTVANIISELNTFGSSLTALTSSVATLTGTVSSLSVSVASNTSDVAANAAAIASLQSALAALEGRVTTLEGFHP